MAVKFSLTVDCTDPGVMMRFWAEALGYQPMDPPQGFADWLTYFRHIGVPEEELRGATSVYLVDPEGAGPTIFFQEVPERNLGEPRTDSPTVLYRQSTDRHPNLPRTVRW